MAAAWSFSKKDGVETISRVVSVRSLDGRLVRCKVGVRFHRAAAKEVVESAADEAAMLLSEIIGEEIIQDELPFDAMELGNRLKNRTNGRDSRIAAYNVSELDLVRAQNHGRTSTGVGQTGRKAGGSNPPPPARPSGFVSRATPSPGTSVVPSRPGAQSAVVPTTQPPVAPSRPPGLPQARSRTLWATALASCPTGANTGRIGQLLSAPFRDSVAQLVLQCAIALEPASTDRLALLRDRTMDRAMSLVVSAAGACLGAALYRVLVAAPLPQRDALEIVETACREALGSDAADAETLGRYMASDSPLRDLARRAAAALGNSDDAARIFEALSQYAETLRADFAETVKQVQNIRV